LGFRQPDTHFFIAKETSSFDHPATEIRDCHSTTPVSRLLLMLIGNQRRRSEVNIAIPDGTAQKVPADVFNKEKL